MPSFRLNNPAKTELAIIQNTCELLRVTTQANQCQGTNECVSWLNNLKSKDNLPFIKYDINDFSRSITENGLLGAIYFAKVFVNKTPDKIDVVLYCRKSVLFQEGEAKLKKNYRCVNFNFSKRCKHFLRSHLPLNSGAVG